MTEVKEKVVYEKSTALTDVPLHFCPGLYSWYCT